MLTRGSLNTAYPIERDPELIAYVRSRCVILGVQEARHRRGKPLDVETLAGPQWDGQELGDGMRSAAAILWHKSVNVRWRRKLRHIVTARQIRQRGRRLRPRFYDEIVTVDPHTGGLCHEISVHLPLKGTRLQGAALNVLAARIRFLNRSRPNRAWCVNLDGNMPLAKVARRLRGEALGPNTDDRIVGHVVSKNMRVDRVHVDHHVEAMGWTDHPFATARCEAPPMPKKRKARR